MSSKQPVESYFRALETTLAHPIEATRTAIHALTSPTPEQVAAVRDEAAKAGVAPPVPKPSRSEFTPDRSAYSRPGPYFTRLDPKEEAAFEAWAKSIGQAPSPDYDLRGFWKAMQSGDPRARRAVNPVTRTVHFPDTWKTPYSRSFSNESIYALPDAPHWEGAKLIDKNGNVVFEDKPPSHRASGNGSTIEAAPEESRLKELLLGGPQAGETALGEALIAAGREFPTLEPLIQKIGPYEAREDQGLSAPVLGLGALRRTPGIIHGALTALGGLTSIPNLEMQALAGPAVAGAAGLVGKTASSVLERLAAAGFSGEMLKGLYNELPEFRRRVNSGDTVGAREMIGQMAVQAPLALLSGAAAIHGPKAEAAIPAEASEVVPEAEGSTPGAADTQQTEAPVPKPAPKVSIRLTPEGEARFEARPSEAPPAFIPDAEAERQASTVAQPQALPVGPGHMTAGSGEGQGHPLAQTVQSLSAQDKISPLIEDAVAEKPKPPIAPQGHLAKVVQDFRNTFKPAPESTSVEDARNHFDKDKQVIDHHVRRYLEEVRRLVPDEKVRSAMFVYAETRGTPEERMAQLQDWADRSEGDAKTKYVLAQHLTPQQRVLAENERNLRDAIYPIAHKWGVIKGHVEDYMNHMLKDPTEAGERNKIKRFSVEFARSSQFGLRRRFPTIFDMEQEGFHPVTDIAKATPAYVDSVYRAIRTRRMVHELANSTDAEGRPNAVIAGDAIQISRPGKPVAPGSQIAELPEEGQMSLPFGTHAAGTEGRPEPELATLVRSGRLRGVDNQADYEAINHPAFRGYRVVTTDKNGNPLVLEAPMKFSPDAARMLKDMIEPSAVRQTPAGRLLLRGVTGAKKLMTFASPFHAVNVWMRAAPEAGIRAAFRPRDLDAIMADPGVQSLMDHGLQLITPRSASEGLVSGPHSLERWMFEDWIPRVKAESALADLEHSLSDPQYRRMGFTPDEIAKIVARRNNELFTGPRAIKGHLGTNAKTWADLERLVLFAPGFEIGNLKYAARALLADPEVYRKILESDDPALKKLVRMARETVWHANEPRMNFAKLAAALYFGTRLINAALNNGETYPGKPFTIVIGKGDKREEFTPRSQVTDLAEFAPRVGQGLISGARTFASGRLSPLARAAIEGIVGRNLYTGKPQSGGQTILSAGENVLPFFTQAFQGRYADETLGQKALGAVGRSVGIHFHPGYTKAEKIADSFIKKGSTSGDMTPKQEAAEHQRWLYQTALANGTLTPQDFIAETAGKLTPAKQLAIIRMAHEPRLFRMVYRLPLKQALDVYAAAKPNEQEELYQLIMGKAVNKVKGAAADERAGLIQEARKGIHAPPRRALRFNVLGRPSPP